MFTKDKKRRYLGIISLGTVDHRGYTDSILLKELSLFANTAKVTLSNVDIIAEHNDGVTAFAEHNDIPTHFLDDVEDTLLNKRKMLIDISDKTIIFNSSEAQLDDLIRYAVDTKTPCSYFVLPK